MESRRRARMASSVHDVADDLLELILVRVGSPVSLVCAAATCRLWRRLIANSDFLRRFSSLHSLIAGHLLVRNMDRWEPGGTIEFVPSPQRAAVHLRELFSLDYLTDPDLPHSDVMLTDSSRGGLLAFVRDNWDIVVCDPLTKQHKEFNFSWPPPGEEEEEDDDDYGHEYFFSCLGAFLVDAEDSRGPAATVSDFRVLCVRLIQEERSERIIVEARVYSARDDCWVWSVTKDMGHTIHLSPFRLHPHDVFLGRAGGFLFWSTNNDDEDVLVVDESTGEFSTFTLASTQLAESRYDLPHRMEYLRAVSGGGAGTVRFVRVAGDELEVLAWEHGTGECVLERRVGLSQLASIEVRPDRTWCFSDTMEPATVQIVDMSRSSSGVVLSLDVDTLKLERVKKRYFSAQRVLPYHLPWPPTINGCL